MPDSDSLYHRLFAHPRMVEGLVREFAPRAWIAGLEFSGLQRVNPKFHCGRWKAATASGELIALSPDSVLWPWQPQARYYLLDMGAFPKKQLVRRASLVALLFRLERRHSPEDLRELLDELIGWFRQHEGYERLKGLFAELVREVFAGRGVRLSGTEGLSEMKTRISVDWDAGKEQWVAKGKAEALLCLLAERFGAVAPSWQKRIRGAKLATLERWFKRAIVASDLPSVFHPPR